MDAKKYVLGIDPGDETGIALLSYSDKLGPVVEYSITVDNGVRGFVNWWNSYFNDRGRFCIIHNPDDDDYSVEFWDIDNIACEKFIIRPDFVGDNESLKIEGVLHYAYTNPINFQMPSVKPSILPGGTEAQRFQMLRRMGYDGSPHELDAVTHGLVWLRQQGHKPTLEMLRNIKKGV